MQFNDNSATSVALADALKAGNPREVSFIFLADWSRDGTFSNTYSDLSDNVVDATVDAQFTGQYPAELEINDGYAQRQMSVTLAGEIGNTGVDVVKYFSPFSSLYGGQIGAVNTPVKFEVAVLTPLGVVNIRQFTGFILQASPSRKDGTVELTLADITSQLTNPVTFIPSARPQVLAQWGQSDSALTNSRMQMRGGNSLSWYLLEASRQSGLYQGPKPPSTAVAYWTLCGGALPEIGNLNQMPRDGRQSWPIATGNGAWIMSAYQQCVNELPRYYRSFDNDPDYPVGPWSPHVETPDVYPRYMWRRGPYGPEMKFDVYNPDSSDSGSVTDGMRFVGTTSTPILIQPYNSSYRDRLGMGGWLRFDSSISSTNTTSTTVMLTGFAQYSEVQPGDEKNRDAVTGPVGWASFSVNPRTRQIKVHVSYANASAGVWTRIWDMDWTPAVSDGVHYVGAVLEFPTSGAPVINIKIDDTVTTRSWNISGGAYPVNASSYVKVDGRYVETSGVHLYTTGGAQHWGVWFDNDQLSTSALNWSNSSACMNYTPRTDIGPSMARVLWTPSVVGVAAWDVMKAIGSSDLGVLYTTEDGILHYQNWEETLVQQQTGEETTLLTLDSVEDLEPYTTFDSIANSVTFSSQNKYFTDEAVFKASDPQQFQVASGRTARWQTTVDDCMSVMPGPITTRRLAQGYWSTTPGSGDNPLLPGTSTPSYTSQDFMQAYAPDKWKNGYEAHNRGDVVSDGQQARPPEGLGVWAYAAPGWASGDQDPRHITLVMQSYNSIHGRTSMAAVDDNTGFLNVRGYRIVSEDQVNETCLSTDSSSFATYGTRNIVRPQSDWASDYSTQYDLSQRLADNLSQPMPLMVDIPVLGDPRRQLQDIVLVSDPDLLGGPIWAVVVGINRRFSTSDGISETLTLRTAGNRSAAWVLGSSDFSQLGSTTILS